MITNFAGQNATSDLADSRWSFDITNEAGSNPAIYIRGLIGVSQAYNEYGGDYAGTFRELEQQISNLGEVEEIDLYIFSYGGFIYPALALHNVIQRHPARFNGIVDGIAASAAVAILSACDFVRVPRNAQVMIHNAESVAYGDHRELEKMARQLRCETRNIANLYADRILGADVEEGRPELLNRLLEMMNEETWMTGEECVELGLADETGAEQNITNVVNRHREHLGSLNMAAIPEAVRSYFDTAATAESQPSMDPQNQSPAAPSDTPAVPAEAPAAPAEPATTDPQNQAPASPAAPAESSAPAAPAQPTQTAPTVEAPAPAATPGASASDLTTAITNAVQAAVAPLQEQLTATQNEVTNLRNLHGSGAPSNAFGDEPPVGDAPTGDAPAQPTTPSTPQQKIATGLTNILGDKLTA